MIFQSAFAYTALLAAIVPGAVLRTAPASPRHAALPAARTATHVFVSDESSSTVYMFRAGSTPKLLGTITTGISRPLGLTVDSSGTLYVPNSGNASITEYPAGQKSPSVTLTSGIKRPQFTTVDAAGDLWVSDMTSYTTGDVVEYLPGATAPNQTLTSGIQIPEGVVTDAQGNLYVANQAATSSGIPNVVVFPPGATTPSTSFGAGTLSVPLGIALDRRGNIYVADFLTASGGSAIYVFGSRSHKLIRTIYSNPFYLAAGGLAVDKKGRLYAGSGGLSSEYVLQFPDLGNGAPLVFYQSSDTLFGVAVDPAAQI